MRALAVFFGVVYHCARVFGFEPWHIQNAESSAALDLLARGSSLFRMPLLFLLAGVGTFFAFRGRDARAYARERVQRLLVPLLFGVLVIVPPQVYVERLQRAEAASLSFVEFYGETFETGVHAVANLPMHHLWFLRDLFAVSLVALPLLVLARRPIGTTALAAIGDLAARRPWLAVVAPAVVLVAIEGVWRDHVPGAGLVHFLVLFVAGYVLTASAGAERAVDRVWRPALAATLVLLPLRLAAPAGDGALGVAGWEALSGGADPVIEWLGILALVGLGGHYLSRPIPALRTAAEVAYPFYVWHQTVILLLAYPVVRAEAPVAIKFALLLAASFGVTLALSRAVLLTAPTRFLFGLKRSAPPERRSRDAPELRSAASPATAGSGS
jgi:glucan biosynthesis protein C